MRKFSTNHRLLNISSILFACSVILIIIVISCRKINQQAEEVKSDDLSVKFFTGHSSSNPVIAAAANFVKHQNEKFKFLNNLTKRIGFPYWDKSMVFSKSYSAKGSTADSGNIVYVPFARDTEQIVNATLIIAMKPTDTSFRILYDWQYASYGFDSINNSNKWTARDVFHIFSLFDKTVFNKTRFRITDERLLLPSEKEAIKNLGFSFDSVRVIYTLQNNGKRGNKEESFVDVCNDYVECTETAPCDQLFWDAKHSNLSQRTNDDCCTVSSLVTECTTYYLEDVGDGGGTGDLGDGGGGNGDGDLGGGGGGAGWQPIPDNGGNQNSTDEPDIGLDDNDPNLIWWDASINDPNTVYLQQAKPNWQNMYNNYPKNADGSDDLPVHDLCIKIGGEVLSQHNAGNANNGCALRISLALNYSGINIPKIQGQTWQGADGKNYFYYAQQLYNWMTKALGQPDIHLTAADGAPDGTKFNEKLIGLQNRGIYIMKPKSQKDFGASGHASLWGGLDCIGGHNYFAAASDIYIWKLPQ